MSARTQPLIDARSPPYLDSTGTPRNRIFLIPALAVPLHFDHYRLYWEANLAVCRRRKVRRPAVERQPLVMTGHLLLLRRSGAKRRKFPNSACPGY